MHMLFVFTLINHISSAAETTTICKCEILFLYTPIQTQTQTHTQSNMYSIKCQMLITNNIVKYTCQLYKQALIATDMPCSIIVPNC